MLKNLLAKREEGFTLIEIVLVLAIAGLIMVIVFVAVNGAQAARRDTQRKTDTNRLRAALEQSASNNSGSYPGTIAATATFVSNYLPTFIDPDGSSYTVTYQISAPGAKSGVISYQDGYKCNAAKTAMVAGTAKQYALLTYYEQGGVVCVDNQ